MGRARQRVLVTVIAVGAGTLAAGGSPATAAAATASEARATAVTAFGGRLVWSSYRRDLKRWVLMTRAGGRSIRIPVSPRRRAFDADLGPDERGRTVVVYSRCRREPTYENTQYELPSYATGRGCDVYRYSFAGRNEQLLRSVSRRDASETQPSIWRGRIAFSRVYERRAGTAGAIPRLYIQELASGRRTLLPGGTLGRYQEIDGVFEGGPGPIGLDLGASALGFAWNSEPTSCESGADGGIFGLHQSEVWTSDFAGNQRLIEKACTGDPVRTFSSPAFVGETLLYHRSLNQTDTDSEEVRRWDPSSGAIDTARGPRGLIALAPLGLGVVGSRYAPTRSRKRYVIEELDLKFVRSG